MRLIGQWSGTVAVLIAAVALIMPSPYIIESPGPTFNTIGEIDEDPVITVDGAEAYETDGNLDLTTVRVAGPPSSQTIGVEVLFAALGSADTVTPSSLVYPTGTTAEEVQERNAADMTTSQSSATAAALTNLDIDYEENLSIAEIPEGSPAEDKLQPDDEIRTVSGNEVTGHEMLVDTINEGNGDPITLDITRDSEDIDVEVPVSEGADGSWQMGVFLNSDYEFPFDVDVALEDVGGPSAGLMFSLGIIDVLTPGAMVGGEHIAGTGTITNDGEVGAIGGITQKVQGAHDSGATVFLAPQDNCAELEGNVPEEMTVYSVGELDEARSIVESNGRGDSLDDQKTCG